MFNRSKSRLSYKASKLRMLGFPNINSHFFFKDRKPLKHIYGDVLRDVTAYNLQGKSLRCVPPEQHLNVFKTDLKLNRIYSGHQQQFKIMTCAVLFL